MAGLWRMMRLTARYPGRFIAFLASGLVLGGMNVVLVALCRANIALLNHGGAASSKEAQTLESAAAWCAAHGWDRLAGWLRAAVEQLMGIPGGRFLWVLIGAAVAMLALKCVLQYVNRYLEGWLHNRVLLDAKNELATHLLSLDFGFFQGMRQGELISRLTNDLQLLGRSVKLTCVVLTKPVELLCLVVYIFALDWRLALFGLVAVPAGAAAYGQIARKIRRAARKAQEKTGDLTSVMVQFLSGIRIVKAFACEAFEERQFKEESRALFGVSMKRERARALETPLNEFVSITGGLVVLAVGGMWVLAGELASEDLMAFFLLLLAMYAPAKELARANSDFQETYPGAQRVFTLLDREPAMREGTRAEPPADAAVRFEDVSFSYTPGTPVATRVDLTIPAGKTVALVGPTGAGKSTLADLLLRFYDPDEGRITLGGVDLRDYTFGALRGAMALVAQDAFLFNGTIRDNIAYGRADASADAIERAAKLAHVHDEIMAFPDGYDTIVGERGARLSGGQRQRVSIARALFKNAPLLILDEATSALDAESERRVQQAIDEAMLGRTSLVIAHRLATVRRADAIAVLEEGRIAAVGTHAELVETNETYARFVALQHLPR